MVNCAAPFWFKHGIDWKRGGFYDALDLNNFSNGANRKRLRTATRQIYVFSEASRMGFHEGKSAVKHGLDFLYSKARGASGGYLSHFDLNCDPSSKDQDTYDLAFVLFSLAQSYRLLRQEREREEALLVLQYLDTELRHPTTGFLEGSPHRGPRRQNPHMHLLEATLAWLPFDETGGFRRLADELVCIFQQYFLCKNSGAICEFFDETLLRRPGIPEVVEPGHLLEWIWLLTQYFRATGNAQPYPAQIYRFAHAFGKNPKTGLLYGELDIQGNPLGPTVRLWPHAEWVRAEVSALEAELSHDTMQLEQASTSLWRFLDAAPTPGLWLERHDSSRDQFVFEPAPATSLYHVVGAFSALAAADLPRGQTNTSSLKTI